MGQNETDTDGKYSRAILVCRLSALGDVAMAVPVVYGVCRANPDVRLILLTKAATAPLWVNPPANLVVVGADMKQEYRGLAGIVRLFNRLYRQYRFDAVADLHQVLRTRVITALCRLRSIPVATIDKGNKEKAALIRSGNTSTPLPSSAQRYEKVFNALGLNTATLPNPILGDNPAPDSPIKDICPPKKSGEIWIGIAPFAAHPSKIYPPEKMLQVVAEYSGRRGVKLFLFGGGKAEQEILDRWATNYPGVTSLAGKHYGLAKELALMSHLDCMIAMDSGNMHLAAIAGAPVVSVWGATHPAMGFTPDGFNPDNAVQSPLGCRPCSVFGEKPCKRGDMQCMTSISPQQIIDTTDRLINGRRF